MASAAETNVYFMNEKMLPTKGVFKENPDGSLYYDPLPQIDEGFDPENLLDGKKIIFDTIKTMKGSDIAEQLLPLIDPFELYAFAHTEEAECYNYVWERLMLTDKIVAAKTEAQTWFFEHFPWYFNDKKEKEDHLTSEDLHAEEGVKGDKKAKELRTRVYRKLLNDDNCEDELAHILSNLLHVRELEFFVGKIKFGWRTYFQIRMQGLTKWAKLEIQGQAMVESPPKKEKRGTALAVQTVCNFFKPKTPQGKSSRKSFRK